ncbi:cyclase [Nostoc sp. 3335mG]|nr:cyclase [Nostoc sp. 3335mG]
MSDIRDARTDDAPASSAKDGHVRDEATDQLVDAKGDHVVGRAVTINKPAAELFAYFRDFSKLSSFMENVVRVDVLDGSRSHWVVKAPAGKTVEWDARITEERAGELIAWVSEDGADIANSGRIEFRDAGTRGTVVTATIAYDPPAGTIGKLVAKLFQREPAIQARRDLRRFKQLMETGEIATSSRTKAQLEEEKA